MSTSRTTCAFAAGLVALLVMGVALPGHAAYTKLYRFNNTTGEPQSSVRAVTHGLESITSQHVECCAKFSGWPPATLGYTVTGGVLCTTLTYAGAAVGRNAPVGFGWQTADGSCRLRDLRWGSGTPIFPEELGAVPGGGMVFYDELTGDLIVVITNDTEEVLILSDVEFGISGYALSLEQLDSLLGVGFVELRVASIDDDIDALCAEISEYESDGTMSGPSANSLRRKLEGAAAYKHDGLAKYLSGDLDKALFLWAKAAQRVGNFISEVTTLSERGNLAMGLYDRWILGIGGLVPAPDIRDALLALPEGQSLQSLEPLPCGALPAYPGLDPANCVEWPVDELYPGEFTAFVVHQVGLGAGFVMGGSVLDAAGNVVLDWLEQSVAEPGLIDESPPVITNATATPDELWPPDHSVVNMTLNVEVTDNSGQAIWYVAGVTSNQPDNGSGDGDRAPDWGTDPDDPQALWLRAERSGNDPTVTRRYTITLMAIDAAGNISAPYEQLIVPVEHDSG